jgi:hypothetical protein
MDILADGAACQRRPEDARASPGAFDSVCGEIKEDMHKIEEDSKNINCYAILDLILHSFKCFIDSIKCCFKIKTSI